jgi:hypothetical protein
MPWTGAIYVRDNGQFTGSLVWTDDLNAAIKIQASRHDTHDQDIANGITACLNKNGANSPTTNIDWAGHKITTLGGGTVSTDAARYGQTITALAINPATKILTATRADGTLTVDLTPIVVAGDTSDFARLSLPQTFAGLNVFTQAIDIPSYTITKSGGNVDVWTVSADSFKRIWRASGAFNNTMQWIPTSTGASDLYLDGDKVLTDANTSLLGYVKTTDNAAITGNWSFVGTSLQLPLNLVYSTGVGYAWAYNVTPSTMNWTPSAGGPSLGYVVDASSYTAGAAVTINSTPLWDKLGLKVINAAAPTGGKPNDCAIVQTGANKGLWSNIAGTWTKIV